MHMTCSFRFKQNGSLLPCKAADTVNMPAWRRVCLHSFHPAFDVSGWSYVQLQGRATGDTHPFGLQVAQSGLKVMARLGPIRQ